MQFDLTQIVDALPGLGWSALPDGRAELLNGRWLEYTGLSEKQATGFGWMEAIHPDDRSRLLDHWRSCLASGGPADGVTIPSFSLQALVGVGWRFL